jgi:hypothetical protein
MKVVKQCCGKIECPISYKTGDGGKKLKFSVRIVFNQL